MDPTGIVSDPSYFLLGFEKDDALFIKMDRDAYHRSIFLDQRILSKGNQIRKVPVTDLYPFVERSGTRSNPPGYIFHIAHCGSTLLARALDVKDRDLVLREPSSLRQLGSMAGGRFFGGSYPEEWIRRVRLTTALLARRYDQTCPVIVKANVPVNFMLRSLLTTETDVPCVLLYFGLEDYLLAVLRSEGHRNWVINVSAELGRGLN